MVLQCPSGEIFLPEMVRFGALLMGSTDTYVAIKSRHMEAAKKF